MANQQTAWVNISELAKLTWRARETVSKLVSELEHKSEPGRKTKLYKAHEALPLVYEIDQGGGHNLNAERARMSHHDANMKEIQEALLKESVVKTEDVYKEWQSLTMAWKSKMLGLPAAVVLELSRTNDKTEIMQILKLAINDSFEELIYTDSLEITEDVEDGTVLIEGKV